MLTGNPTNGRGCGSRQKGGVYLCHGMSEFGSPIEDFILDPVIEWKGKWQRGYKIVPSASGHNNNVVIFVGESFYKCLWDYVEETRLFGASRKVADNFPFRMLTPGQSYILFAHRRAYWTDDFMPPMLNRTIPLDNCHLKYDPNITQRLIYPGEHLWMTKEQWSYCTFSHRDLAYYFHKKLEINDGQFTVNLPSVSYQGNVPIKGDVNPKTDFKPGVFLALLLTHIEMPYTPNVKAQNEANKAGFEVYVTEY